MKNLFYKTNIDICNDKQMFNFLKGHFTYDTMSSWNRLKSIANNVKLYNLNLSGDYYVALQALQAEDYMNVNSMIEDWEADHSDYVVGFNGRSSGYLVLYNKGNNCNILPDFITECETYDEYKRYAKEFYGSVKALRSDLRYFVNIVRSFDKLCDELAAYVDTLSVLDLAQEAITTIIENYNESYYEDLHVYGFKPLEQLEDEKALDITEIKTSHALYDLLALEVNKVCGELGCNFRVDKNKLYIEAK